MTRPCRFLSTDDNVLAEKTESDHAGILAAILCVLFCVGVLIAVGRHICVPRASVATRTQTPAPNLESGNRGMEQKMIEGLLMFTYNAASENEGCVKLSSSECAICLGEYANDDKIRMLPDCGHGFHVGCVDTWLSDHSSCPSCRQVLVSWRCKKCCEFPTISGPRYVVEDGCIHHSSSSCSSDNSEKLPENEV